MTEITCPKCGGTDFYLARQYEGTELWSIDSATRDGDDGPISVATFPGPDSDEYDAIKECTLYCNSCYSEVAELEEMDINYG